MVKTNLGLIYKTNGASPVPFITVHKRLVRINKLAYRMMGHPDKVAFGLTKTPTDFFITFWVGPALRKAPYWQEAARKCVPDAHGGIVVAVAGIGEWTGRGRYFPVSAGPHKSHKYTFKLGDATNE